MGQFSVEKPVAPGSVLSGNQQCGDHDWVLIDQYDGDAVRRAYAIATCLLAMACSSVMILSLPSLASTGAARTLGYL